MDINRMSRVQCNQYSEVHSTWDDHENGMDATEFRMLNGAVPDLPRRNSEFHRWTLQDIDGFHRMVSFNIH